MFKKSVYILVAMFVLFSVYFTSSSPAFWNYAESGYEIYLAPYSDSSCVKTIYNKAEYLTSIKYGESCVMKKDISADEIFNDFNAELIFIEETAEGTSYYGFTEKLKYAVKVGETLINLHVFIGKTQNKVGAPIIFGSF